MALTPYSHHGADGSEQIVDSEWLLQKLQRVRLGRVLVRIVIAVITEITVSVKGVEIGPALVGEAGHEDRRKSGRMARHSLISSAPVICGMERSVMSSATASGSSWNTSRAW